MEEQQQVVYKYWIENTLDTYDLETISKAYINEFNMTKCIFKFGVGYGVKPTLMYLCKQCLEPYRVLALVELKILYTHKNLITFAEFEHYSELLFNPESNVGFILLHLLSNKGIVFPKDILEMNLLRTVKQSLKNMDFLPITNSVYMWKSSYFSKDIAKEDLQIYRN